MKITSTISWSPFFSSNPMIIMGHTIKKNIFLHPQQLTQCMDVSLWHYGVEAAAVPPWTPSTTSCNTPGTQNSGYGCCIRTSMGSKEQEPERDFKKTVRIDDKSWKARWIDVAWVAVETLKRPLCLSAIFFSSSAYSMHEKRKHVETTCSTVWHAGLLALIHLALFWNHKVVRSF